jgi:starch synthase
VLSTTITDKLLFENLEEKDVAMLKESNINNLHKHAIDYADAVVQASAGIEKEVLDYIKTSQKPFMEYPGAEDYIDAYQDFYEQFIEEEEVATIEK